LILGGISPFFSLKLLLIDEFDKTRPSAFHSSFH